MHEQVDQALQRNPWIMLHSLASKPLRMGDRASFCLGARTPEAEGWQPEMDGALWFEGGGESSDTAGVR